MTLPAPVIFRHLPPPPPEVGGWRRLRRAVRFLLGRVHRVRWRAWGRAIRTCQARYYGGPRCGRRVAGIPRSATIGVAMASIPSYRKVGMTRELVGGYIYVPWRARFEWCDSALGFRRATRGWAVAHRVDQIGAA